MACLTQQRRHRACTPSSLQRFCILDGGSPWRADEHNPQEVLARADAQAEQACSLYVSLVYRAPDMLQGLLETYGLAEPISRRVLERLGDTLAVFMTSSNPELQAAVVDHPPGSEPLLLSMLVKLTGVHQGIHLPSLTVCLVQIPKSSQPEAELCQHSKCLVMAAAT